MGKWKENKISSCKLEHHALCTQNFNQIAKFSTLGLLLTIIASLISLCILFAGSKSQKASLDDQVKRMRLQVEKVIKPQVSAAR